MLELAAHSHTPRPWRYALLCLVGVLAAGIARAEEPIKIGVVLTFVPPGVEQSQAILDGMKLAADEAGNAVAGRKVEILAEDDEAKPSSALSKMRKLILSDQVDLVVGGLSSNIALAIAPFAIEKKTPFVVVNAGADSLTSEKCSPWVIRTAFSNTQMAAPLAPWLLAHKPYRKIFMVIPDYQGGRDVAIAFKKAFTQGGGEIVGEAFTPFGHTQDFAPYLVQAKAANPDAIYAFYAGSEAILFVKQYDQFGLKGKIPLIGTAFTVSPLVLDAQGDSAEGFLGTANYLPSLDIPENKKFVAAYEGRTKKRANEFADADYDTMKHVLGALAKVAAKTIDKDALMQALRTTEEVGARGKLTIDPRTNNIVQNIYITEARKQNGKIDLALVDTVPDVRDEPRGCKL